MKKILLICSIALLVTISKSNAQKLDQSGHGSFWVGGTNGMQTVPIPGNKGTIKLNQQGDKFTNVTYTDVAGKTHRLLPAQPGTNGAPTPSCKYPLPDACFGTADKNIGLCICKPTDLAGAGYTITFTVKPTVAELKAAKSDKAK